MHLLHCHSAASSRREPSAQVSKSRSVVKSLCAHSLYVHEAIFYAMFDAQTRHQTSGLALSRLTCTGAGATVVTWTPQSTNGAFPLEKRLVAS